MKILVSGGAGFVGSAVVRLAIAQGHEIVNVDALTYAACIDNISAVSGSAQYKFEHADIRDREVLDRIFDNHRPDSVMHLAAESHVDRSIGGPEIFVETNVVGTFNLLEASRAYWSRYGKPEAFRFLHISTDEVFGSLGASGRFTEKSPYAPNSPYSATKAASDHLARAWGATYQMPILITNSSNNYGPFHFPEKLVPLVILRAFSGTSIPVYGTGHNVRDWLYVEDHADALLTVLKHGQPGRNYNIGGGNEVSNIDLVQMICAIFDEIYPSNGPHAQLINHVPDRPGHDDRYAIDSSRIQNELGWRPSIKLEEGLRNTINWYLENQNWWKNLQPRTEIGDRFGTSA